MTLLETVGPKIYNWYHNHIQCNRNKETSVKLCYTEHSWVKEQCDLKAINTHVTHGLMLAFGKILYIYNLGKEH